MKKSQKWINVVPLLHNVVLWWPSSTHWENQYIFNLIIYFFILFSPAHWTKPECVGGSTCTPEAREQCRCSRGCKSTPPPDLAWTLGVPVCVGFGFFWVVFLRMRTFWCTHICVAPAKNKADGHDGLDSCAPPFAHIFRQLSSRFTFADKTLHPIIALSWFRLSPSQGTNCQSNKHQLQPPPACVDAQSLVLAARLTWSAVSSLCKSDSFSLSHTVWLLIITGGGGWRSWRWEGWSFREANWVHQNGPSEAYTRC